MWYHWRYIQQRMQLQLNKQEEQIEDLFKSVREIKNMNLKFMSMGKGLLIGFGLMVATDVGVFNALIQMI
mgnify:CR=1 FL=1